MKIFWKTATASAALGAIGLLLATRKSLEIGTPRTQDDYERLLRLAIEQGDASAFEPAFEEAIRRNDRETQIRLMSMRA